MPPAIHRRMQVSALGRDCSMRPPARTGRGAPAARVATAAAVMPVTKSRRDGFGLRAARVMAAIPYCRLSLRERPGFRGAKGDDDYRPFAARTGTNSVGFRSAKARPFAERKPTLRVETPVMILAGFEAGIVRVVGNVL